MFNTLFFVILAISQKATAPVTFEDLKPVLKKHCLNCHNGERPRGGLDMTTKATILAGSDSGVSVASGKPKDSLLYRMVSHIEAPHMPPNSARIPESELVMIERWIVAGLPERKDLAKTSPMPSTPTVMATKPTPPTQESTAVTSGKKLPVPVSIAWLPTGSLARPLSGAISLGSATIPFGEPEIRVIRSSGDWLLVAGGEGGKSGKAVLHKGTPPIATRDFGEEFDTILAADIHPASGRIVIGGPSRIVKVFSMANGAQTHAVKDHIDWILDARYSPDGLFLATSDRSGTTLLTEAETGAKVHTLRAGGSSVPAIAWHANGNAIVTGSADGWVRLWDAHHGQEIASSMAHEGGVMAVAALPEGRWLSIGRDKTAKIWSGKFEVSALLQQLPFLPVSVSIGSNGNVAIGMANGEISQALFTSVSLPAITVAAPSAPMKTTPGNSTLRQATLSSLEELAEKLKEDAAAHPERRELTESYLSLCKSIVLLKAEILKDQQQTDSKP